MTERAEKRIGSVIAGKWRVDALIGSGSMAAVYAVTHRNGARAALKILHPTLCVDESVCERFLGEGYLTNSIKHSGIVRVHDDGMTEDGCVFLVMDLLEGRTFEAYRQEQGGRLGVSTVLDIADELMDILHTVHQAGIIHRDLKPQNVFVCDDGSVKLLDFGVARVKNGSKLTRSLFGLVLGTPSFMAPEQAVGNREEVDFRTDIWSLGATLFTALTGETVHLGPNVQAKLLAAATAKARSIAPVRQDLHPSIALAIDMALRFKKDDRWQSVDAFRRALRDARAQAGLGEPRTVSAKFDDTTIPDPPTEAFLSKKAANPASPKATLAGIGHSSAPPPPMVMRVDRRPSEDIDADTSGPMSFFTEDRLLLKELKSSRGYVWKVAGGLALVAGVGIALLSGHHSDPRGQSESATVGRFADPPASETDRLAIPPPVPIDTNEAAKDAAIPPGSTKSSMTPAERERVAHSIQPPVKRAAPSYTMVPVPEPDPIPTASTTPQPMPKAVHQSVKEEALPTPPPAPSDPFSTPE